MIRRETHPLLQLLKRAAQSILCFTAYTQATMSFVPVIGCGRQFQVVPGNVCQFRVSLQKGIR